MRKIREAEKREQRQKREAKREQRMKKEEEKGRRAKKQHAQQKKIKKKKRKKEEACHVVKVQGESPNKKVKYSKEQCIGPQCVYPARVNSKLVVLSLKLIF